MVISFFASQNEKQTLKGDVGTIEGETMKLAVLTVRDDDMPKPTVMQRSVAQKRARERVFSVLWATETVSTGHPDVNIGPKCVSDWVLPQPDIKCDTPDNSLPRSNCSRLDDASFQVVSCFGVLQRGGKHRWRVCALSREERGGEARRLSAFPPTFKESLSRLHHPSLFVSLHNSSKPSTLTLQ